MKIITILKQVPDAEARIRANADGVDLDDVTFVIDGMDEFGVEQALRIREDGLDVEIIALALGPVRFEDAIRTSLAMGADRAIHIETDEVLDPISQAKILAKVISEEDAQLVLVGGKQADWDSTALGPATAEVLGWPHSDWTTRLEPSPTNIKATHDSDDGSEDIEMPLPAVVTTQQGLNEPRYPTLPNIMKAKRKELKKLSLADVGGGSSKLTILSEEIESKERLNKIITGDASEAAKELINLLANEAKVL